MQNAPQEALEMPGLSIGSLGVWETASAKSDLMLIISERERQLSVVLGYDIDLFEAATAERMLKHFDRILQNAVQNPNERIGQLQMLTDEERQQMLIEWNDTAREHPAGRCLHHLFEAQVTLTPDRIALVSEERALTYNDLNERANQLANYLRFLGVGPEILVGILMERSMEMIVGILGVLKAGGAYLALDPVYPRERINFMLDNTRTSVLLTQQEFAERIDYEAARLLFLDAEWEIIGQYGKANPPATAKEDNLAYVIYTSGSTGKPKGVAIEHRSPVVLAQWGRRQFGSEDLAGVLAATSICFDLSIFEIFAPLSCGGVVILAQDVLQLPSVPARNSITLINTVPSAMTELARVSGLPESVRTVNLAGEALKNNLAQQVYQESKVKRVFNLYGPSEDTTYSTGTLVLNGASEAPTIGRPVSQTQVYVLDRRMEPVPVRVAGELYIGGDGLARDYLNGSSPTAEKFVPNPFSKRVGARLYRTGDLARYRPQGEIEFLGRNDQQVKIRGYRVELGEVELALMSHEAVREAAVVARDGGGGDKQLVAYMVGAEVGSGELRRRLRERLPEYMAPGWFVWLDEMPLTPNGKLDRKVLAKLAPPASELAEDFVAPRDMIEFRIAKIWEDVLDTGPIGIRHNFFNLGGHSLSAVRLMSRIKKTFHRELPLSTLFQNSTIEQLASILRQQPLLQYESPVVGIKTSGARNPFFCVHPVGGNVLCYTTLAQHFDEDRPFYGLQSMNLGQNANVPERLEETATRYLEAIRSEQPQGPYLLGGWSLGGALTFEIARQLEQQDQRVALLALFDSWAPLPENKPWSLADDESKLLAHLARAYQITLPFDEVTNGSVSDELMEQALEQAKKAQALPAEIEIGWIRHLMQLHRQSITAVLDYRPKVYAGQITLFRAQRNGAQPEDWGWGQLSDRPVNVYSVPGDHYSMLANPHAQTLARRLNDCLKATEVPEE
jgi:amino acid adenylation domain-containing protein